MRIQDFLKLVGLILICEGAGVIGSFFTSSSITGWYKYIQKPSFNPPDWVFAPVWIILFALMGISLYLVLKKGMQKSQVRIGILLFGFQLLLNIVWSFLFFGLQNPFYAFLEIIALNIAIGITIYWFIKIDKTAGYLLIPYYLWVCFAAVLNFFIWRMNL